IDVFSTDLQSETEILIEQIKPVHQSRHNAMTLCPFIGGVKQRVEHYLECCLVSFTVASKQLTYFFADIGSVLARFVIDDTKHVSLAVGAVDNPAYDDHGVAIRIELVVETQVFVFNTLELEGRMFLVHRYDAVGETTY